MSFDNLSESPFGAADELLVTVGAQKLLTESLAHMPPHTRAEALKRLPFLARLRQPRRLPWGSENSYTNAELAIAFKNWLEENGGTISRGLHDQIDAWSLAIASMARQPTTYDEWGGDVNLSQKVGTPTPFIHRRRAHRR